MAISATFLADFNQFNAAVAGAESNLKGLDSGAARVGTTIDAMSASSSASLASLAGALGISFSIATVVNFGRSVLEAGSNIQKMADQTDLSISQIQKLEYVASQSDSSIESLVGAVQNLQQRLGDDTTGAAGAMAKLRINVDAFNKLDTYTQLTTLAEAVRQVNDPTEQASIAAALFGKTWKEILPAIKGGMAEVGDQATIMADSTVKSLDRIGDALKGASLQMKAWGGTFVLAIEEAGYRFGEFLSQFNPEHFGQMNHEFLQAAANLQDPSGLLRALANIPPVTHQAVAALRPLAISASEAAYAEKQLTESAKESIAVHEKQAEAVKKLADEQRKAAEELKAIGDSLSGNTAIVAATKMADAIGNVGDVTNFSAEAQQKIAETMQAAIEAMIRMGLATDPLIDRFVALQLKANEYARSMQAVSASLAAASTEQARLTAEMERAYKASGGTDQPGFDSGLSGTGRSPMRPFVGLAPSVFSGGGVAGVNTPGTYAPVINIDASNSFFDTPDGQRQFASKVSSALISVARSQGTGL